MFHGFDRGHGKVMEKGFHGRLSLDSLLSGKTIFMKLVYREEQGVG